jgi:hypothetical protein
VEPRPEGAKGLAGGFPLHIHTQGAEVPLRLEDDEGSRSPFRVVGSDSFEQCLRVSSNAHVLGDYGLKFCTDHWDFLQWFLSACMGRSEDLKKKKRSQPTVECQDGGQPYAEKEESKCNITFREEEMCSQSNLYRRKKQDHPGEYANTSPCMQATSLCGLSPEVRPK